jgi:hypothetical protein
MLPLYRGEALACIESDHSLRIVLAVASAILFLASDEASFITGTVLAGRRQIFGAVIVTVMSQFVDLYGTARLMAL